MLPLSEIRDLRVTVDTAWRSPVADAIAAAWDIAPGTARYWRSSATHVFVVPIDGVRRWLRFAPIRHAAAGRLSTGVTLARHWTGVGAAQPVPTLDGHDVVDIDTPAGPVRASLSHDVTGVELSLDVEPGDEDELATDAHVRHWGAALATLHTSQWPIAVPVPARVLPPAPDAALAARIAELEARVAALAASEHGVIHGDFELDNVRFDGGEVGFFDVDEGGAGAFVTDIALAARDLDAPGLHMFLDGYRSVRAIADDAVALIPSAAALAAAHLVTDASAAVDVVPTSEDPDWLIELHANLRGFIDEHRALAGAATPDA